MNNETNIPFLFNLNDPDQIGDTWPKLMNAYINKNSSFFQIAGKYETSPHPNRDVFVTVIGFVI